MIICPQGLGKVERKNHPLHLTISLISPLLPRTGVTQELGHRQLLGAGEGGILATPITRKNFFRQSEVYDRGSLVSRSTFMVYTIIFSCQFVVSATGDYTFDEPDKLVDWDCIQQVVRFP